jgi:ATP-dependent DNA helicase RecG
MLRRLRDRGLLELHAAGSASHYTLPPSLASVRGERDADRGELDVDRGELDADRGELGSDRGELGSDRGEPRDARIVARLGKRPRQGPLRAALVELCAIRPRTASELAGLVRQQASNLVQRHLSPMVEEGRLALRYPDAPTHPDQAYRATAPTLFPEQR